MADTVEQAIEKLVVANRILYGERVLDAYGHISTRSPANPERFYMARSMAPGLVNASDILEFDMKGQPVVANGHEVYSERFIHAAVMAARPEINSVVHSHAEAVLPFAVSKSTRLRAVVHTCGFLGGKGVPVFEIRDVKGDATNLLVCDMESGDALAASLGAENLVLMRGHGMTVTGRTIEVAVFQSVFAAVNARIQFTAMQMGEVEYLSAGETGVTSQVKNPFRAWELWCDRYAP